MKKALLVSVSILVSVVTLAGAGAVKAATPSKVTITIPTTTISPQRGGNVGRLSLEAVPNGTYTGEVTVTNYGPLRPENRIMLWAGSEGRRVHSLVFSRMGNKRVFHEKTKARFTVKRGKIYTTVAMGRPVMKFSGKVKIVLTNLQKPQAQTKHSKTQPKVAAAQTEQKDEQDTATLPATGAEGLAGLAFGVSGVGYAVHRVATRKKQQ